MHEPEPPHPTRGCGTAVGSRGIRCTLWTMGSPPHSSESTATGPNESASPVAEDSHALAPRVPRRGDILGRFVIFQVKLIIDGLKDMLLSPLSMVALALGLISPSRALPTWRRLYAMGRGFDRWLDLFPEEESASQHPSGVTQSADALFEETQKVLQALRRGGASDPEIQAKLSTLARALERARPSSTPAEQPENPPPTRPEDLD